MCATCRNLGVFPFLVDPFIQNVLSLKLCVKISNRFRRWISRVEIFNHEIEKETESTFFFHFRGGTAVTLTKAQPCLLRKEKENAFFFVSERYGRDSRENTTVPLTEVKP